MSEGLDPLPARERGGGRIATRERMLLMFPLRGAGADESKEEPSEGAEGGGEVGKWLVGGEGGRESANEGGDAEHA